MVTGSGNALAAFIAFIRLSPALMRKPRRSRQSHRDRKVAPIPALRALRSARRTLLRIAVVAAPLVIGVGRLTGRADLCFGTAFFNAEIAERSAERAEKKFSGDLRSRCG